MPGPDVLRSGLADSYQRVAVYVDKILKGRGQAVRPPDAAADQSGGQPQDRQGPRPHHPAVAAAAGGSGDRVVRRSSRIRSI